MRLKEKDWNGHVWRRPEAFSKPMSTFF